MILPLFFLIFLALVEAHGEIEGVKRYAVCFSKVSASEVKNFELLILDPDDYTDEEIAELKKFGIILIAYINIAEFETYRDYSIPDSIIIGENPNWADHFYVNIASNIWQNLIFEKVIPKIISKNFDGFFVDMVDIVEIFPHFKDKIIDMIMSIKSQNREKFVILNNGWALMDTVKNYVDAFLIEELFTRYDFKKKKYFVRFEREYVNKVKVLRSLGKKIFTLDYLPEGDKRKAYVKNLSRYYGFTPYVSTIELNKIYR